jgi:secreted PhoX family phosphatase
MKVSRRDFAKFLGASVAITPSLFSLTSCSFKTASGFGIKPSSKDELVLAGGLDYKVLIKWGDAINDQDTFGFNNDYLALHMLEDNRALMWVNHEYFDKKFVSEYVDGLPKTKEQVDKEMYSVGGSIIEIKKEANGRWRFVANSEYNRRLTAKTKIPFAGGVEIAGQDFAQGTFAGCAGGYTPWGTFLSCEENFHKFVGDLYRDGNEYKERYQWKKFYDLHSHHYGWVVEIEPTTGKAKKLPSLGRFAHECCTVTKAKDGTIIAYSGDDKANEFVYKFVSSKKESLDEGELFVADFVNKKWLSLDRSKSKLLQETFKDQLEVQIYCREAARLLGATPCDRPEDVEIHPTTGDVYITMTNNYDDKNLKNPKNNFYGQIVRISHVNGDHLSENFEWENFILGGKDSGISCPDNLAFDKLGNLWVCTDMSGSRMNKFPYESFKNNGLFYIPLSGPQKGQAIQVASAPVDAEFTGIQFSKDYKTLFLSVQHPGEKSNSLNDLSSHWPDGGSAKPRPAVVQIYGETLDKLMSNKA